MLHAAGRSSNLGAENYLIHLARWGSLVASTRADLEEVRVFSSSSEEENF